MTKRLSLLPWALLGVAVVAALTVLRSGSPSGASAPSLSSDSPPPSRPLRSGAPTGPSAPSGTGDAPLTESERRDAHVHIGHEECEEGVKRYNELSGLSPTDPKGIHLVGACLPYGNVAWYKCMLRASTQDQGTSCNRRLLTPNP